MKKIPLTLAILLSVLILPANTQERSPTPAMAEAYIQSPIDGSAVSSPVTIRFGLRGIGVAPAGTERPNTGHHHLLINLADADMPSFDLPLPATDQVRHFGLGQTETLLELEPGQHTLQLVLGDHLHIPHASPIVSEKITITVTE